MTPVLRSGPSPYSPARHGADLAPADGGSAGRVRTRTTARAMWCAAPLALIFLVFRLAFLPSTPDDLDSVNFGLGVRHFDIATHSPHPPGYPVYIALGKLSKAVIARSGGSALPPSRLEARALGVLGAVFGALAVFPLLQFFRCVYRDDSVAFAGTVLTIASPLFLFTAGRPMSDVPGLAAAYIPLALLATAYRRQQRPAETDDASPYAGESERARIVASGRMLVAGAFMAGLAIGVRSQVVWLTLPLLAVVLLHRVGRGAAGALLGSTMTFTLGVLLWFLPLIAASGGPSAYFAVVAAQGREDLAGVDLLVTHATARRLAFGLLDTLVAPWAVPALGGVVLALALVGLTLLAWRSRSGLLLLLAVTLPYAAFHLLFHESATTRYALPLVAPVAILAARGLAGTAGRLAPIGAAALVVACIVLTVPASILYARTGSPLFRALVDLERVDRDAVLAMHHSVALASRGEQIGRTVLQVQPKREWLSMVDYWTQGGQRPVWFLANPKRTDLAAIDPASRRLVRTYEWPFAADRFIKGIRPGAVAWDEIRTPPGWFVGEGWSLTPELGGVVDVKRGLPGGRPISVFVRSRADPSVLMIGGRHLGHKRDPDARVVVSLGDRIVDAWTATPEPGFFLRFVLLPSGTLAASDTYTRLDVRAEAADRRAAHVNVAIEQFDVQPDSSVVFGFDTGWHEQEYEPSSGLFWRWCSEQARTRVHHGGRDLTLKLRGESPLRYFDAAPRVTVRAGAQILTRSAPAGDFVLTVRVPAAALDAAEGVLTLETDKVFIPADRSNSGDRRHLGLRILSFELTPER